MGTRPICSIKAEDPGSSHTNTNVWVIGISRGWGWGSAVCDRARFQADVFNSEPGHSSAQGEALALLIKGELKEEKEEQRKM